MVVLLEQILNGSVMLTLHLRPHFAALTIVTQHLPECSRFKCTMASAWILFRIPLAVQTHTHTHYVMDRYISTCFHPRK